MIDFFEIKDKYVGAIKVAQNIEDTEEIKNLFNEVFASTEKSATEEEKHELPVILEHSFRIHIEDLIVEMEKSDVEEKKEGLSKAIDNLLLNTDKGIGVVSVFVIFEDLVDTLTLKEWDSMFSIFEERLSQFPAEEISKPKAKNTLLRSCVSLQKRLSKSDNAPFCGRIHMFMSNVFQLNDKSALNLRSDVNVANVTECEKEERELEVELHESKLLNFTFYRVFWGLQEYFQNPSLCIEPTRWEFWVKAINITFKCLKEIPLVTKLTQKSKKNDQQQNKKDINQKKKKSDPYFTKFLTSSNLLSLQLKDSDFRRNILIQMLILFQSLITGIKDGVNLPESKKSQVKDFTEKATSFLKETTPDGIQFTTAVTNILEREKNWIKWKNEGCPPFEKNEPDTITPSRKRKQPDSAQISAIPKKQANENSMAPQLKALLSTKANNELLECDAKYPPLETYLGPILDESDPEEGMEIEETYKKVNDPVHFWRTLRLMCRSNLTQVSDIANSFQISDVKDMLYRSGPLIGREVSSKVPGPET